MTTISNEGKGRDFRPHICDTRYGNCPDRNRIDRVRPLTVEEALTLLLAQIYLDSPSPDHSGGR